MQVRPIIRVAINVEPSARQFPWWCGSRRHQGSEPEVHLVEVGLSERDIADLHLYDAEDLWPAAVDWFVTLTAGRPVWLTEFGGPAPELEPRDPNYQAERLAAYLRVVDGLPVDRAYYFKLTDDDGSIHDRSGLFDRRGRPKPSLDVFSAFMAAR